MKIKIFLATILIIAQLLFAFLPFIPGIKDKLPYPQKPTPRDQLEWIITATGIEFALISACLAILLLGQQIDINKFGKDMKSGINELRSGFGILRVKQVQEHDFYDDFLHAARKAKHTVLIMYLATESPDYTRDDRKRRYYEDLAKIIKLRPNVRFRRIIRDAPGTRKWTAELIQQLQNAPNVDVAVLKDRSRLEMPLALSTQIVDGEKVWLVAIASHHSRGPYRDLFIDNPVVASALITYYERIWEHATTVMKNGQITPDGNEILKV